MVKKRSVIPGIITMGNMVAGFFSILLAARYNPQQHNVDVLIISGTLVFVASCFDALDGAAARALNVESEIGMQLDSLADAVSYGIAPGVIAYQAYFYQLPVLYGISTGALLSVLFPVCAIYRLARFNCESTGSGFKGLPSPPAGIIVAMVPVLFESYNIFFGYIFFEMPLAAYVVLFTVTALLMISNIDYTKMFSDLWKKPAAVRVFIAVLFISLIVFFKAWSIFIVSVMYMLWGIIKYIIRLATGKAAANKA